MSQKIDGGITAAAQLRSVAINTKVAAAGDAKPKPEPLQTGQGIGPEQQLAGQLVGLEEQRRHRLRHPARQGEDLVRRVRGVTLRGQEQV